MDGYDKAMARQIIRRAQRKRAKRLAQRAELIRQTLAMVY